MCGASVSKSAFLQAVFKWGRSIWDANLMDFSLLRIAIVKPTAAEVAVIAKAVTHEAETQNREASEAITTGSAISSLLRTMHQPGPRAKRQAAEQFENHLDKLASAASDIASMSDDGLLDQSDADCVYQMFIERAAVCCRAKPRVEAGFAREGCVLIPSTPSTLATAGVLTKGSKR